MSKGETDVFVAFFGVFLPLETLIAELHAYDFLTKFQLTQKYKKNEKHLGKLIRRLTSR